MNFTVSQAQGRVPVTILGVQGNVDGSTFQQLIDKGQELYTAGARDIVLDLSAVPYMSSAGLVALHSIAAITRGQQPPDPESGWEAFRAVERDQDSGLQPHVKLFNPQPRVSKLLTTTGFDRYFEIHTDLAAAVASFD
jgi:anti-anti-sigma regulatory factor